MSCAAASAAAATDAPGGAVDAGRVGRRAVVDRDDRVVDRGVHDRQLVRRLHGRGLVARRGLDAEQEAVPVDRPAGRGRAGLRAAAGRARRPARRSPGRRGSRLNARFTWLAFRRGADLLTSAVEYYTCVVRQADAGRCRSAMLSARTSGRATTDRPRGDDRDEREHQHARLRGGDRQVERRLDRGAAARAPDEREHAGDRHERGDQQRPRQPPRPRAAEQGVDALGRDADDVARVAAPNASIAEANGAATPSTAATAAASAVSSATSP